MSTIDQTVDTLWESIGRGDHHPESLRGKLNWDDAYPAQLALLRRHEQAGARQVGWKVGLTAKAIQAQIGFHEPIFGYLLDEGHRPDGATFEIASLIRPKLENELCITMASSLTGPGVSFTQARAAIATIAPAFEIIEQRHSGDPDFPLVMADNAQQKAFVTGAAVPLAELDLAGIVVEVLKNGQSVERAAGAEVLGTGPIASIAWLADRLAGFGLRLEAGMQVMSGSFTRQVDAQAGDTIEARFAGVGSVSAIFR